MSNKNYFDYCSLWEEINNKSFNSVESHRIKIDEVPYNRFTMNPKKWITATNTTGVISKQGRYNSGIFAHQDIALNLPVGYGNLTKYKKQSII